MNTVQIVNTDVDAQGHGLSLLISEKTCDSVVDKEAVELETDQENFITREKENMVLMVKSNKTSVEFGIEPWSIHRSSWVSSSGIVRRLSLWLKKD